MSELQTGRNTVMESGQKTIYTILLVASDMGKHYIVIRIKLILRHCDASPQIDAPEMSLVREVTPVLYSGRSREIFHPK